MVELTLQCLYKKKVIALFPILILYVLLPMLIKMFFIIFRMNMIDFFCLLRSSFMSGFLSRGYGGLSLFFMISLTVRGMSYYIGCME